jgi:hypothetical protein
MIEQQTSSAGSWMDSMSHDELYEAYQKAISELKAIPLADEQGFADKLALSRGIYTELLNRELR